MQFRPPLVTIKKTFSLVRNNARARASVRVRVRVRARICLDLFAHIAYNKSMETTPSTSGVHAMETASAVRKVTCNVSVFARQDRKFRLVVSVTNKQDNVTQHFTLDGKAMLITLDAAWMLHIRPFHNTPCVSVIYTDSDGQEWDWNNDHDEVEIPWGLETPISFEMDLGEV